MHILAVESGVCITASQTEGTIGELGGGNAFCPGTSLILVNLIRGVSYVLQSEESD